MGGSSKPRSPLHWTVREERKVPRYVVGEVKVNERQRLALSALASEFRSERATGFVPGDLARAMGDGNGWSAMPTIRRLRGLGWVRTGGTRGAAWQTAFLWTPAGMEALFELDPQHRDREACRTCAGRSEVRHADRHFSDARAAGLCSGCVGTLLVRRAKADG